MVLVPPPPCRCRPAVSHFLLSLSRTLFSSLVLYLGEGSQQINGLLLYMYMPLYNVDLNAVHQFQFLFLCMTVCDNL
ncbi:hypothetical protein JHK86_054608 [Glycine max]|nr:hypothetical protein JHK86_054608 [Glycine max]